MAQSSLHLGVDCALMGNYDSLLRRGIPDIPCGRSRVITRNDIDRSLPTILCSITTTARGHWFEVGICLAVGYRSQGEYLGRTTGSEKKKLYLRQRKHPKTAVYYSNQTCYVEFYTQGARKWKKKKFRDIQKREGG